MVDLWNKLTGVICFEVTAADPERILNLLMNHGLALSGVTRDGQLVVRFWVARRDRKQVIAIAENAGGTIQSVGLRGFVYRLFPWKKRKFLLVNMFILCLMTLFLSEWVLFVDVVGNEQIPTRQILEAASGQGLHFGAAARAVRSEQIKNELLGAIDTLQWVGVNLQGCRAVITVRERDLKQLEESPGTQILTACTDGIIENIVMYRGDLKCQIGQAVSAGDVLVASHTDPLLQVNHHDAKAEIYALTIRKMEGVLPLKTFFRASEGKTQWRIAVNIEKKRINLYSGSGILPSGCGKMNYHVPLQLPGGDCLPVTLVIERIVWYDIKKDVRGESLVKDNLSDCLRKSVLEETISGEILSAQTKFEVRNDLYVLQGNYQCREMIARPGVGIYLEGDTQDDSQNSQRRAG